MKYIYNTLMPLLLRNQPPVMQIIEEQNWMTPYLKYLEVGKLLENKAEARRIVAKAANYQVVRGTLY